jgi:AcrR family transcriptional regulator
MVSRSVGTINGAVDVRQQVLDSATRLFLQYGFKKTTMSDVARAVGISKGALYLHFDNKEAIFTEISDQIRTQMLGLLAGIATRSDLTPDEKLRRMHLEGLLFAWDRFHQAPHAPEIWGETTAMFASRNAEFYKQCQRLTARVLEEGQEAGRFRTDLNADRVAEVLSLVSNGFGPPYLRISERRQLEEGVSEAIDLILDGLRSGAQDNAPKPLEA